MEKRILTLGVVLALVAVLAVPMAALAGTTEVSGNLSETLEVSAPSGITLTGLTGGDGSALGTSDVAGTVTCTHAGGYTLTVASNNADGKMSDSGGAHTLINPLLVLATLTADTGAPVTTIGNPSKVAVTTSPTLIGKTDAAISTGTNSLALSVSQAKQYVTAAQPAGNYTLILTFTVRGN